jgi:hypothetical protein
VFSATFFLLDYRLLLWRRSGKKVEGDRIWKNLRRFSGWMFAGCVTGIVAFASWKQSNAYLYESADPLISMSQRWKLRAAFYRYRAPFNVFYPVHLLCVIYAMSTLLRRVSDHASHSYYNTLRDAVEPRFSESHRRFDCRDCVGQYALYYWVRSMHVIAMLLCSFNVVPFILAAGFGAEAAKIFDQLSEETDPKIADKLRNEVVIMEANYATSVAVGRIVEAAALVFVASGFLLFFPAIIVMFRRVERKMDGLLLEMCLRTDDGTAFLPFEFSPRAADGSETQVEMPIVDARQYLRDIKTSATLQRWRFVFCLLFVTSALVCLSSNGLFLAFAFMNQHPKQDASGCPTPQSQCNSLCQDVGQLMLTWYRFTPEVLPLVASFSSMLPLLFSLWLMTTPEDRDLLMHPSKFLSEQFSVQPGETARDASLRAERIRMGINLQ